ncbi:Amidase [Penicillium chermesinum]|uniref:amidase n=1 Tax=Penicillium chermesinum TaxID=63820 RepID=A0A9W9NTM8_9EURO|nr:Amidase [Penicillium chermesinum]KAJ5225850.1 Amidase [Penicillium chermesinum]
MADPTWRIRSDAKRQAILDAIPQKWRLTEPVPPPTEVRDVTGSYICKYLDAQEIEITESDAVDIAAKTTTGQWSAVKVTEAFCHRAALAHQLVSCLHEIFFDAAIEDAKKLDQYFAEHKAPIGPLHGLPVSLKDQFHVKGVETTMGYVGWINTFQGIPNDPRRGTEESELVRELRSLGAVLYCKTSVPATLMSGETVNNIIGYTWNPKNRLLSCGGSSGGEGALLALRGSPVGFGSDIGGSIRIPAGFNFLYGLRPSSGRIPYQGVANSMDGQNSLLSVLGPLAPTARSLTFVFKSVLSTEPWFHDPLVLELPWRDVMVDQTRELIQKSKDSTSLAFGIMYYDGFARIHPPIHRGMKLVEQTLKRLGHTVIPWTPPSHAKAHDLASEIYGMDGGVDLRHHFGLSGEEQAPQVIVDQDGVEMKASAIAQLNIAKREYQKEYMDYWNSTAQLTGTGRPVDGFICPIAPHAAVIPQQYRHVGYSSFVDVLDYPSVTIPVTHANKSVDVRPANAPAASLEPHVEWDYDADTYDGAPVAVQLVGRRLQEEKMLTLAEYIGEEIARELKK